ncbi:MAG: PAS domain S-box protein [Pyrinomonadaceae bacterium]
MKHAEEKTGPAKVTDRTAQLEAAAGAILMVDASGKITHANQQAAELFGYTPDELLGQPLEVLVPARYEAAHPDRRAGFFRNPSTRAMGAGRDLFGRRKDGSEVPIEIGLNPIETDEGQFVIASIIDITERKRAEERFRVVVEASPSAILMANADGLITLVNTQTEKLFGYQRAELLGQKMEMLVPVRYEAAHPEHRSGFFTNPSVRAMGAGRDLYGRRKDGNEVPIEIGLNPIETEEGRFVIASIIDITERKRAEERFRVVVEASPSAILMVNAEGVITLVNNQTEKLFGYGRAELLGQKMEILVPERYRETHPEHRENFRQQPSTRAMGAGRDLFGRRKDGSEIPIEIGLNPISTDEGLVVLASIIDITQRKKGEEKLLLQSTALECAANAIVITDANGSIQWVNRAFSESTGYALQDVMGRNLRILKSGKQDHGFYEKMWVTILSGKVWRDTIVNRRKDGGLIQEDLTITPIQNGEGKITHFVAIKQDISERLRAAEALRQSEERLQTVVDNLAEGLVIAELDGQLIHWNRAALEMHGFTSLDECLIRLPEFEQIFELRTPDGAILAIEEWPLPRVIRGEQLRDVEIHVRRLDTGLKRVFSYGGQTVREPSGKVVAFVTITDVTERRRAEQALNSKSEELAAATQQLWQASKLATMGELAASVAHELNNPLATIGLRAELLIEQLAESEGPRISAGIILNEVERMAGLVVNLLEFSRRSYRQISTVNVADEISNSVNFISYYLRNRNVVVVPDFRGKEIMIQADRQQLRQLFLNVLTNAADAITNGGTLTIRAKADQLDGEEGGVQIEFIDTGIGIPPENLERVWDSFFTTKPEGKGTGLGLAICRRVVEEHGGTIQIESELQRGTTVRLRFPATTNNRPVL